MSFSAPPQPIKAFGDNFKGKRAQVTAGARGEGAAMIRRLGLGGATVAPTTHTPPSPRRGLRFAQIGAPSFVATLALVTTLLVNGAAKAAAEDEAIILGIEKDMAAAQTVDGVVGTWDKDVVWYDIKPGEVDGLAAVRADFDQQIAHVKNIRTKILRIKIVADTHIGYAYSTQHLVAYGVNGAPDVDFTFRETDCFQKKAGKWTLMHQQISLPVDLTSGKAVLDSK
jgi:ketosteroid isomerase-like protein